MYDYKLMAEELRETIQKRFPDFEIIEKKDSKLMKIINKILFFVPTFMTSYTTTIGKKIYIPEGLFDDKFIEFTILAHEYVHMCDEELVLKKFYKPLYLFPQILALFSLLSILAVANMSFLWCLLFLVFLAPIPAPGRTWIELRGYGMSIKVRQALDAADGEIVSRYANRFTKGDYYYMWPFRKKIKSELCRWYLGKQGCINYTNPAFREVLEITEKHV